MNEGRAGMEQVIHHYELQRAEALRLKQESEIVLPYMRAAMEELDAQLGTTDISAAKERVHASVTEAPEARRRVTEVEEAADPVEEKEDPVVFEPKRAEDKASTAPTGFGRASIASLIDQKTKKEGTNS